MSNESPQRNAGSVSLQYNNQHYTDMQRLNIFFVFNRLKRLNQDGTAPLNMSVHYKRRYAKFIKIANIRPDQWDKKNQRVKNHPFRDDINLKMLQTRLKAEKFVNDREHAGEFVSLDDIVDHIKNEDHSSFIVFAEDYIDHSRKAESTKKQQLVAIKHLKNFASDVQFKQLNYNFVKRFEKYVFSVDKYGGGKMKDSTVKTMFANLGRICREAVRQKLMNENPFKGYKVEVKKTAPVFLRYPEETAPFENLNVSNVRAYVDRREVAKAEQAKDIILLSLYTGLRLSDFTDKKHGLKVSDLVQEGKGLRLVKQPKKTKSTSGVWVRLPLWSLYEGKAESIFRRLMEGKRKSDRLFNVDPTTVGNWVGKFCKHLGIEKKVTVHTFRHSCAMGLLNHYGLRLVTVQKILGHANIDSTLIYARLSDDSLDKDLENL